MLDSKDKIHRLQQTPHNEYSLKKKKKRIIHFSSTFPHSSILYKERNPTFFKATKAPIRAPHTKLRRSRHRTISPPSSLHNHHRLHLPNNKEAEEKEKPRNIQQSIKQARNTRYIAYAHIVCKHRGRASFPKKKGGGGGSIQPLKSSRRLTTLGALTVTIFTVFFFPTPGVAAMMARDKDALHALDERAAFEVEAGACAAAAQGAKAFGRCRRWGFLLLLLLFWLFGRCRGRCRGLERRAGGRA
jgi:hypothetical protein